MLRDKTLGKLNPLKVHKQALAISPPINNFWDKDTMNQIYVTVCSGLHGVHMDLTSIRLFHYK